MVAICRENALRHTKIIREPKNESPFPEYFDWADHIATRELSTQKTENYVYHLNKAAADLDILLNIFRPYMPAGYFDSWKKEWRGPSLSAAWIHDIGMVTERRDHGVRSAEALFENDLGFDFQGISVEDRIKIGLLCIRHHNGWPGTFGQMKRILEEKRPAHADILGRLFQSPDEPRWDLDFSGKLISTADFLRYRGKRLKNDLKQPFFIWSECEGCETVYGRQRDFCSTSNCDSNPAPTVVVRHDFKNQGPDPEIPVYDHPGSGKIKKTNGNIAGGGAYVPVRENYQIFTRGDMSLFDVAIIDLKAWMDDLTQKRIDYTAIIPYIYDEDDKVTDQYKTVARVNLDVLNMDAAVFAFQKYIADFLRENITTENDDMNPAFQNNSVLHIILSDQSLFSAKIPNETGLTPEVKNAVKKIKTKFRRWREHDIVLPVEIEKKKLKVISL
ncbi:conserved hypothetical protein [Candidatus Desulfarcum epimagneticum]|uniref:HD domain-containing protein n=1 Tax=uncultured Desulfobacteraceae bacterium TaxID=218296 RepID=A0A484HGD5_9BACT|nr:conserved hypothetical protein [uncultured Desulfobacteraceae bacterium]